MTNKDIPTLSQLRRLCAFWQKILRLQDWNVTVGYVRGGQMTCPTAVAENGYDLGHKSSCIKILHPHDNTIGDSDVENSLVHELLHLHITPAILRGCDGDVSVGDKASDAEESAIVLIAEALVKLRRAISV